MKLDAVYLITKRIVSPFNTNSIAVGYTESLTVAKDYCEDKNGIDGLKYENSYLYIFEIIGEIKP